MLNHKENRHTRTQDCVLLYGSLRKIGTRPSLAGVSGEWAQKLLPISRVPQSIVEVIVLLWVMTDHRIVHLECQVQSK
jgi:hypothetical protein